MQNLIQQYLYNNICNVLIKMLSSLSNSCFGLRSFPDVVTEVLVVKNIQESKIINEFQTKYKRRYNNILNVLIEHGKD